MTAAVLAAALALVAATRLLPAPDALRPSPGAHAMLLGMGVLAAGLFGAFAVRTYLERGDVRIAALGAGLLGSAVLLLPQGAFASAGEPDALRSIGAVGRIALGLMLLAMPSAAITAEPAARRRIAWSLLAAVTLFSVAALGGASMAILDPAGPIVAVAPVLEWTAFGVLAAAAARIMLSRRNAVAPEGIALAAASGLAAAQALVLAVSAPWTAAWWCADILGVATLVTLAGVVHALALAAEREQHVVTEAQLRSERLNSLGTLVAGVAHEINNPLSYIRSNIELAIEDVKEVRDALARGKPTPNVDLDESVRGLLSSLEGAERIGRITSSLNAVARKGGVNRETVDLNEVAASVADLTRLGCPEGVRVVVETEPSRVPLDANGGDIHQCLLNLAKNAVEAVAPRGAGTVTIRVTHRDKIAEVEVADDGPGLAPGARERLFTPFFTTKSHGAGLGRAIVHTIVTEHGGEVRVDAPPSGGARFTLRFPITAMTPVESRLDNLF